jgi:two-component system OmpR family response regulator
MRALVVEDDSGIRRQLAIALTRAGYVVETASDGEQGCYLGDSLHFDVAILDMHLPIMGGLEILHRWRRDSRSMAVLVLTGDDAFSTKLTALESGADDYLTKPFMMQEILARVRALIRRNNGHASPIIRSGNVVMDTRSGDVTCSGQRVDLTRLERRLLEFLLYRAGTAVTRTDIYEHVYAESNDSDSNTLEVIVGRLRRKVGTTAIETVRNHGYRMPAVVHDL